MALSKRTYVSGQTIITAENLNDIQDSIIALEKNDGVIPHIGDNGNWYLGATDTGKPSRGAKGDTGEQGPKGDPGTDYVLTSADKSEIAALVRAEIPNGDEVAYG